MSALRAARRLAELGKSLVYLFALTAILHRAERARSPVAPPAAACACCGRAGEYNGFASDGPTTFACPEGCACHD